MRAIIRTPPAGLDESVKIRRYKMEYMLNKTLKLIQTWMIDNSMTINYKKCEGGIIGTYIRTTWKRFGQKVS